MSVVLWNPAKDGIDHINVWNKGRTVLGRWLSNFTTSPFKHPEYGNFVSIEGFWYYVATGFKHEQLRRMSGTSAKIYGRKLDKVFINQDQFKSLIKEAIMLKLQNDPVMQAQFVKSTLPIAHYYVYADRVVGVPQHQWQMDFLTELRTQWANERQQAIVDKAKVSEPKTEVPPVEPAFSEPIEFDN